MNTKPERLIKDPYFCGYPTDFEAVLKELNKDRDRNGLYTEMEESDLRFDKRTWIEDYCESIGVVFSRVNDYELWYHITLEGVQNLKRAIGILTKLAMNDTSLITMNYP